MNIGQAAEITGLPVKTIRYYEEVGLFVAARQGNGYRQYSNQQLQRLAFLRRAREFGFSIEACRSLLQLYDDENRISADVKAVALQQLQRLKLKAAELSKLAQTLEQLVERCSGDSDSDCPIIEELAGHEASSRRACAR